MANSQLLYQHDEPHGHGDIRFTWQTGNSMLLATTGNDSTVAIYNRQGKLHEKIVLAGLCSGFTWDADGDLLAMIVSNSPQFCLWDANANRKQTIDTGLRDAVSCLVWSKKGQVLAIGTVHGNLTIYNHGNAKRIPILGKHLKRITCGVWSKENVLALGSDDRSLSLTNEQGDTLRMITLRETPSDMHFAEMKTDERLPGENTISMILGKRTLYLYHLPEPDSPTELGFQQRYGQLIQHKWFGDGYILLGFSLGYVVAISTHPREVGQELWQVKNHRDSLTSIAISKELEMIASCGDNTIKIDSMSNKHETIKILSLPDQSGIKWMEWSSDGHLLAVSTHQGSICVFVTQLHSLYATSPPRIAILTSLVEVSIFHVNNEKMKISPKCLELEIEPSFITLGPFHFACGMNNHIWFYDLGRAPTDIPLLLGDREYLAEVADVKLNTDFCVVLCGGILLLHPIETNSHETKNHEPKRFPEEECGMDEAIITCVYLSADFLIFATDLGHIIFFSLDQWKIVTNFRHASGIRMIFVDPDGSKLVFIDDHNLGYIYIPSSAEAIAVLNFPKSCVGVLWDFALPNLFVAFNDKMCYSYAFVRYSVNDKYSHKFCETPIYAGQIPVMLLNTEICVYTAGNTLATVKINSAAQTGKNQIEHLRFLINMKKYSECWDFCKRIDEKEEWLRLGEAAIMDLELDFAIRVYRHIGDAAMVFALEDLQNIDDVSLLSGHCALLIEKVDEAKIFFAKSTKPQEALEVCRDLLQWEQALALASKLAPEHISHIALEYAQQLEFMGNYAEALNNYEKALDTTESEQGVKFEDHLSLCKSGIARTSISVGDIKKGIKLALEIDKKELYNDCAEGLLTLGHLNEAAQLMERAENWDACSSLYVQLKAWQKVETLIPYIRTNKIHQAIAKARESEGQYGPAIKSYTAAEDMDSVVRIYLDKLADPHSASEIVMETKSIDSAKLLAKFYQSISDHESALQFLVMCNCNTEALALAMRQNKMQKFGELLEFSDSAKPSDFLSVAQFFDNEKHTLLAGKYFFLAKDYSKGLKMLLKASSFSNDENTALSLAIDCAATANDEKLANQLIEFLLGDTDGMPKDPRFLFRFYMSRKQYREAAKTAVIIANQEQISGSYRSAHDILFTMYQELRKNNLKIIHDMKSSLILLHRYILVRLHVKLGNHTLAAKLLMQVASNISQFPSHMVPILTSTVIECNRAGFRKTAFTYAVMLMRPEYRNQIEPKYAKKIESIVRKAPKVIKGHDEQDEQFSGSACPACDCDLPEMDVTCSQCKVTVPLCIATGKHIGKSNNAACPECDFLGDVTELKKILDTFNECPMCGENLKFNGLILVDDITPYINLLK